MVYLIVSIINNGNNITNLEIYHFSSDNIPPLNKINGITTLIKKKVGAHTFDVNSDKLNILSRSLSPLKQRSITPPPKNKYDFIQLPPKNSKFKYYLLI